MTGMSDKPDRPTCATRALKVRALFPHTLTEPCVHKSASVPASLRSDPLANRKWSGNSFAVATAPVDSHSTPIHVFHHLNKIHRLRQVKRFHSTINLRPLELGRLVDHHTPGGLT